MLALNFSDSRAADDVADRDDMLERVPIPRMDMKLANMDGESLLYSHEKTMMLYLNDSSAAIWRLCDGRHTVKEIIDTLRDAFPDAASEIPANVRELIARLASEDILELG
jgi:hypothetical protein